MRAVQLVGPQQMEMVEMAGEREPRAGEVLVRVSACGICGSDLHWWAEGGVGARQAIYPSILGHEPVGVIEAVGAGVERVRPGQRVAIEPAVTCGHCALCFAGRHNLCEQAVFHSSSGVPGMFREWATLPEFNAEPVPDSFSDAQAALVEPLSVMVHVFDLEPVRPGDTVAILGAGPIGMLCAAMAKLSGAGQVIVTDRVAHRLRLAKRMGASVAVEREQFTDAVRDLTRGRGAELVIDAAAKSDTVAAGLAVAARGAHFVLLGIPSEANMRVDLHLAMSKELRIQTIFRANHGTRRAIELLAGGHVPDVLVTHRLPLAETQRGFELLRDYDDGVGKVLIEI